MSFYLHDYGEDMKKWDGKPTSDLAEQVYELVGRTTTAGNASSINAFLVSCGQILRQNRRADVTSDPLEGTSSSCLQEVSSEYHDQN